MKIKIEAEGYSFTIPLPACIIMNSLTARMIENFIKRYVHVPFTRKQLLALFSELKRVKKMFPNLILIDAKSADEQRVVLTL